MAPSSKKLSPGDRLIIASHNPGKIIEIGMLLEPYGLDCVGASDLGLEEPEETGATFAENAILKARAAADCAHLPALADDSGLEVEALGGQPGIYSARWAGPDRDFAFAIERVEKALEAKGATEKHQRSANFICLLSLAWPEGEVETFEGKIFGHLTYPPRGDKGFGYDPIFVPEDSGLTFAEIDPMIKHRMSHRARAFRKFVSEAIEQEPPLFK